MHKNLKGLIQKYGGKVVPYKDLPREHQLALALYMSIDGEAWEFPNENWRNHKFFDKTDPTLKDRAKYDKYLLGVLKRNLKCFFEAQYGSVKFGIVNIPTTVLAEEKIKMGSYPVPVKSVEDYKLWLRKSYGVPDHPLRNRWPVILDDFEGNVIQDGHHRFSRYLTREDAMTPCVYYV